MYFYKGNLSVIQNILLVPEFDPLGSVGTCDKCRFHRCAEESTASSCVQYISWKRKCCTGLRLGAMFFKQWHHLQQHPFPEKGSQGARERDWHGGATSSLADSNFYYLTALHEKKPIHKCALTETQASLSLHNMNSRFGFSIGYLWETSVLIPSLLDDF